MKETRRRESSKIVAKQRRETITTTTYAEKAGKNGRDAKEREKSKQVSCRVYFKLGAKAKRWIARSRIPDDSMASSPTFSLSLSLFRARIFTDLLQFSSCHRCNFREHVPL